jgi:hypothetical protein
MIFDFSTLDRLDRGIARRFWLLSPVVASSCAKALSICLT